MYYKKPRHNRIAKCVLLISSTIATNEGDCDLEMLRESMWFKLIFIFMYEKRSNTDYQTQMVLFTIGFRYLKTLQNVCSFRWHSFVSQLKIGLVEKSAKIDLGFNTQNLFLNAEKQRQWEQRLVKILSFIPFLLKNKDKSGKPQMKFF